MRKYFRDKQDKLIAQGLAARRFYRQHPTDNNLFWCPKCKAYKPRNEFNINRSVKCGLHSPCKKCLQHPPVITKCNICGADFLQPRKGGKRWKRCNPCHVIYERERSRTKARVSRSTIEGRQRRSEISKRSYLKHINERRESAKINIKEWQRKNPHKAEVLRKAYKKRVVDEARDNYLRPLLKNSGIPISDETLELKRQQLKWYRAIKQGKEELANGNRGI
jgi:hypothetical protein